MSRHTRCAIEVTHRLSAVGLTPNIQQKLKTFAVTWGLFESTLERAVRVVKKENVQGKRPSTDKAPPSKWMVELSAGTADLSSGANEILKLAAGAAADLMDYRHSLMHGPLIASPGASWIVRNTQCCGAVRNKPFGDAHVYDNLLDLAVEIVCYFYSVVLSITNAPESNVADEERGAGRPGGRRAGGAAS